METRTIEKKDRGGTASMIVASVCNELRNSDLRADDVDILSAFNDRFDDMDARSIEHKQHLDAVAKALHPHKGDDRFTYEPDQLPGMIAALLAARAADANADKDAESRVEFIAWTGTRTTIERAMQEQAATIAAQEQRIGRLIATADDVIAMNPHSHHEWPERCVECVRRIAYEQAKIDAALAPPSQQGTEREAKDE